MFFRIAIAGLIMLGSLCGASGCLVSAASGQEKVKDTAIKRRVVRELCFQPNDPEVSSLKAKAKEQTENAIAAELHRQGLERLKLSKQVKQLHRGLRGDRSKTSGPPPGGNYIAGPEYWTGSRRLPDDWQFVRDAQGQVFKLVLAGQVNVIDVVKICGCKKPDCRYGSPCPACGATLKVWYGPLPEGTTYKGPITVSYPSKMVRLQWEAGSCPQRCPPPPPSMQRR